VTVTLELFPWLKLLSGPLVLRPASTYHVFRSPVLGIRFVFVLLLLFYYYDFVLLLLFIYFDCKWVCTRWQWYYNKTHHTKYHTTLKQNTAHKITKTIKDII
jgi:hypothetical protein